MGSLVAPAHAAVPERGPDCLVSRCVALTFDDGPSPYTATLLTTLERQHVKVTFYVIGPHALARAQDVKRAFRDGDTIGDHTVHHPKLTKISSAHVRYELDTAARQIASITRQRPTELRPPFGAENARVRALAGRLGLSVVMWNVTPRDWKHHNAALVEKRVLDKVRPGAIVDMHDTYRSTIAAVPDIVATLKKRGYTLVTVPQLFAQTGGLKAGEAYFHGPS